LVYTTDMPSVKAFPRLPQPLLLQLDESSGSFELFPAVWSAAENFILCEGDLCNEALDQLVELNAPRLSPLVAYLLATRLRDPNLRVRTRIAQIIASVLSPDSTGNPAPIEVRNTLSLLLGQSRTRQVFALLEISAYDPAMEQSVAQILNLCPFAGHHLVDILSDHRVAQLIRAQAAKMIGRVGYLDALPGLEKLAGKIETRSNGQKELPFGSFPVANDQELLTSIKQAIRLLQAP
jgi:HEAT repeat protein